MSFTVTSADLQKRFDERTLAELASDTDTPVQDLSGDPNVTQALEDAHGRFRAAVLVGGVYTSDHLDDLTGPTLSLAKRIVCELAMANLYARRMEKYGTDWHKQVIESAETYLEQLRKGARLFETDAHIAAGKAKVDGPRVATYISLNLIPDRTRNFYPSRGSRLPLGRG